MSGNFDNDVRTNIRATLWEFVEASINNLPTTNYQSETQGLDYALFEFGALDALCQEHKLSTSETIDLFEDFLRTEMEYNAEEAHTLAQIVIRESATDNGRRIMTIGGNAVLEWLCQDKESGARRLAVLLQSNSDVVREKIDMTSSQTRSRNQGAHRNRVLHSVAEALLDLCFVDEAGSSHVTKFLNKTNLTESDKKIFQLALCCLKLAASIIVLRNRYGSKADVIATRMIDFAHKAYHEDVNRETAEFVVFLINHYTQIFQQDFAGVLNFGFKTAEYFLDPLSGGSHPLEKDWRLPLFLNACLIDVGRNTNVVLKNAETRYGFTL